MTAANPLKVGIAGGGILGLTLAYRLSRLGHSVELHEASDSLGGLAGSHDYGDFVWDRFYHCILPQDRHLLGLLEDLDLADRLRWARTGTGYYAAGRFHSMSGTRDFLRFPLLSWLEKLRLGGGILYAQRLLDPETLWGVTAREWLERTFGRRVYDVFWRPLLAAKLGPHHERVAAVFLWATITRLFGARAASSNREKLGYVDGGYDRILRRFAEALRALGAEIHVGSRVERIRVVRRGPGGAAGGVPGDPSSADVCELLVRSRDGSTRAARYDQVFFTAPLRLAKAAVSDDLRGYLEDVERSYPSSSEYLGVLCLALVLEAPLTPYYVLNIGGEPLGLTGVVEITNLIDRPSQTNGLSLVYLPRYLDSADPAFEEEDEPLRRAFIEGGLKRLFPEFRDEGVRSVHLHRARCVQPLPLVGRPPPPRGVPELRRPFQALGTFMLRCATLNNNEVVGLVDDFVRANASHLGSSTWGAST